MSDLSIRGQNVLWFDDNNAFVDQAVSYLRVLEARPQAVSTWDAAQKLVRTQRFSVVVVDWNLGEVRTGLDFFAWMEKRGLQSDAIWCLASYHFDGAIDDETLPARVRPIPISPSAFSSIGSFETYFVQRLLASSDPTSLPFHAYSALAVDARAALLDEAYEQFMVTIDAAFDSGAVWLLVCGPNCQIVRRSNSIQDALVDQEVWELAESIGFAPFQFFAEQDIDDCSVSGGSLQTYPTLTLSINEVTGDGRRTAHFDTGSPNIYLDAESLRDRPRVVGEGRVRTGDGVRRRLAQSVVALNGTVHCQLTAETVGFQGLKALAVHGWARSNLARRCALEHCAAPSGSGICSSRELGLIGRSLLTQTGVSIGLLPIDGAGGARVFTWLVSAAARQKMIERANLDDADEVEL